MTDVTAVRDSSHASDVTGEALVANHFTVQDAEACQQAAARVGIVGAMDVE